jgi:hypothetical protein
MPVRRDLSGALRADVRKLPRKEPAGIDRAVCGLWGLNRAVACVRDTLARVVGGAEFHGEWNYTISPNTYPTNCAFIS